MRACAAGGNWQLSLALLNTMKKEGVTRTAFNYNIAMQVGLAFSGPFVLLNSTDRCVPACFCFGRGSPLDAAGFHGLTP